MPYVLDPELLRARSDDLTRLADDVSWARAEVLRRLGTAGRSSPSVANLTGMIDEARGRARDLAARADFAERSGYFDLVGSMPKFTPAAFVSVQTDDPALLTALIAHLEFRIGGWTASDNDPILDALISARAELRDELAFRLEVNASLFDIRSALDMGGWGVRRDDLFSIRDTFDGLTPDTASEVMAQLSEPELGVWVDQMQEGILKGGLKKDERIELFAMLLPKLSEPQLRRLEARSRTVNPPLADGHDDYRYVTFDGELFLVEGGVAVSQSDIDQGALGDCYYVASLAAVAVVDPDIIERSVTQNANGTFTVTLYPDGKPVAIVVTPTFPAKERSGEMVPAYANDSQALVDGQRELWPLAYEKALAIYEESYEDIEGGRASNAMEWVTGQDSFDVKPSNFSFDELKEEFEAGHPISLSSLKGSDANTYTIFDDDPSTPGTTELFYGHAYIVTGVTDTTVSVRNPHGVDGPGESKYEFTFTYEELEANFKRIDVNVIGDPTD